MSLHHATLRQLQIFNALANHMSVARTAESLHLTPPAVSIQVRQLSECVGQPLLEQIGKQLYLTAAGKIVAAGCRDLFDRLEGLGQELSALQGLEQGSLGLSIISTAQYFVPRLLGDFCADHPGINVSMFVGNRQTILERLERNQDDLYILGQPPEATKVAAVAFAANPLVAIAYPEHPLVGQSGIAPQSLAEEPFIAREQGSGTRLAYEDFFRRHKTALNIRMELGSNEAIKATVAGRLGISILSRSTVRAELANGDIALLDVQGFPLQRQWYVAHPEQKRLTPAAVAFQRYLEKHARLLQPLPA